MSFTSLLINEIMILTPVSIDGEGTPAYYVLASGVPARVQQRNRQIINERGEEVVANFTAFISPLVSGTPSAGDQVIYDEDPYTLLEVRRQQNSNSTHHYELLGVSGRVV